MPDPPLTSTDLLRPWLAGQYGELVTALLRLDEPEQVHRARVRSRRIRSILTAYAELVPTEARDVTKGLRTLARGLGDLRDVDVLREMLLDDAGPPAREAYAAAAAWSDALDEERRIRLASARHEAGRPRTRRLLGRIHRLCEPPAWLQVPAPSAVAVADRVPWEELARLRAVEQRGDPHDVRKAAKRLRYAAELAARVHPPAEDLVAQARRIQADVGADLDGLMVAAWLEEFARRTGDPHLAEASRREAARRRRPRPASG